MSIFPKSNKKGFTLIELLVVIAIIGILATVIIANVSGSKSKGRDAKRISDIKSIQLSLELYYNDNGFYPLTLATLVPTYMPVVPLDPSDNQTAYKYTAINPAGSTNCSTATVRGKYHLAAVLENDSLSSPNTPLGQDVDYYTVTYGHAACTGSGADFHGNAASCTGTSSVNPEKCYDVTN